jgi:plasmid maintenance system antidote protein VapI
VKQKKWITGRTPQGTLEKTIASLGIDAEEFAMRGGIPITRFKQVLAGTASVSRDMARGFERAVGEKWPWWCRVDIDLEE